MRYLGSGIVILFAVAVGYLLGQSGPQDAAAQDASPVKAVADRDVYYPGTEDLAPDEMRIVACGTGMPSVRPKQAAACFLVELGNGESFLFDLGTGSTDRLAGLRPRTSVPCRENRRAGPNRRCSRECRCARVRLRSARRRLAPRRSR